MKKYMKNTVYVLLILVSATLLFGCSDSEKKSSKGFSIYYIDKSGTKIINEDYEPEEKSDQDLISNLIDKLRKDGTSDEHIGAIPQNITVNGFDLTDGIVTVDFNQEYKNIESQREVLCRAAVVLTLSQVASVEYVSFTINDKPYVKGDGQLAGNMKASDFVSDLGGGNNAFATADFKLYFANDDGSKLKEYKLINANYGEKTKELFIIEKLIKGPDKSGYTPTLSTKVKINNVITANNICYVDFGDNFKTEQSKVANKLVIYSIVDSLSELNEIHKVQISVNGDSSLKYHDDIPLSEPFIRNLDLVESETKEDIIIKIKE